MEQKGKTKTSGGRRPGRRADDWARRLFTDLTGRQIDEAFEGHLITMIGGRPVKKGQYFRTSKELDFSGLRKHIEMLSCGDPRLNVDVIAEHDDFLVVDKPSGISSHPVSLFDCRTLTHWLRAKFPEAGRRFPGAQPIVVPHRLDTGTSGVQIVAKSPEAYRKWRQAFKRKQVTKRYWAWCWGLPPVLQFDVTCPLAHHPTDHSRMIMADAGTRYKLPLMEAKSRVRVLESVAQKKLFLAEVVCTTGATHQVRVHLAGQGFPLVGDSRYDPQFDQRSLKPAFHQLRAVELAGLGYVFRAPTDSFHSMLVRGLGLRRDGFAS